MAPSRKLEDSNSSENRTEWTLEDELQKNEKLQKGDIDILRDFCLSLPKVEASMLKTEILVALLHCCDYDLNQTRIVAAKYFDLRFGASEVFFNRCVGSEEFRSSLEVGYFSALPRRSPQGCRIIFHSLRNSDPSNFYYAPINKVFYLTIDACIQEDPTTPGYVFLFDLSKASLGHVWKWNLLLTRKLTKYSQEGIPLKIQQVHFMNSSAFTHKIVNLFKPLMSKQLWNMLKFHTGTKEGFQHLYEYVPRECLPREYGGHLPDVETLHKENIEWLKKMQPRLDNSNIS